MAERIFKIGDEVSFTLVKRIGKTFRFTVYEGKIDQLYLKEAKIVKGKKSWKILLKELRHKGEKNTLTEMLHRT